MPEVLKAGKQARHDSTIERPAKKISMTDGYAEEQGTETADHSASEQENAAAAEGTAETAGAEAAETAGVEESTAAETDQNE